MMKEKQKSQRSKSTPILIMLIMVLIATSTIGFYAFAKYQSMLQSGENNAEVAKWNISFNGIETTYSYDYVLSRKIVPGTAGHFDI